MALRRAHAPGGSGRDAAGSRLSASPILYVCRSLEVGGAERNASVLVPALRERGFAPTVVALKNEGRFVDDLRAAGVPTHVARMHSRFDLRGALRAYDQIGPRPVAVLSQCVNAQVLGHLVARRFGAVHLTIEQGGAGLGMARHRRLLVRLVSRRVDAAVAVSSAQLPELVDRGFRRDRLHMIPNGVPELVPQRTRRDVLGELSIDDAAFVVLFVGQLRPEKRAGFFVQAVVDASRQDARIHGVVAGDGVELEAVRAGAGESDAIRILGERADIPDLIAAADVVCLTSRTEGTPLALVEAMSLGRACVATAVGGIPEVVRDGVTGVLVSRDGDADLVRTLVELARDPGRLAAMGAAARERYERSYTVERTAGAYAELLENLLSAARQRNKN